MPTSGKPKDPVYSFRAPAELGDAIERHFERLTKSAWAGLVIRRTDAIASLLIVGAMAWDAADRSASSSPGAIIEAGEQALRNLNQNEDTNE
jgi:hypothetical protein